MAGEHLEEALLAGHQAAEPAEHRAELSSARPRVGPRGFWATTPRVIRLSQFAAAGTVLPMTAESRMPPASAPDLAAADRVSRDASIALGLTLPTDTVLYLLLPLYAASFGVSLAEAGLLLAANRLVRIVGYGLVARSYEHHGPRVACIGAVVGSAASSLGYALLPGVWWLLAARLVWGLSFAAMNIATQALATAETDGAAPAQRPVPRHHLHRTA